MGNPRIDDPVFQRAVDLIDTGATEELREHLERNPELLSARAESPDLTDGYFASPYLLWFTAENPIRNGKLPNNIVGVIDAIIGLARRHEAANLQAQIDYTLALVCSGCVARQCGLQREMIDALIDRDASPDASIGPALSHRELDAVKALIEHGVAVDLRVAAALGIVDRLEELFGRASEDDRQIALAAAALNGQTAAASFLVRNGADPNRFNPAGFHPHATPLHNAVSAGHLEVVRVLLDLGSDVTIMDKMFGGDARGWAEHCQQPEILNLLNERALKE